MFQRSDFDLLLVPTYAPAAFVPVRGEGSRVWDQEGRSYLDFSCGIAVTGLGHCHPALVGALTHQAGQLWHVSNTHTTEPALELAAKLLEASGLDRAFFCNSGAEANEAALKMARRAALETHGPDKVEIVSFERSFHGRTLFTVATGGTPKYRDGFGPLPGAIRHLPYNDLDALRAAVGAQTCAIILEPVQGEGGVHPATPEFLQLARELATQHQAALILDEIQTGCGRSGSVFAFQQLGIQPDILTLAKGLGGGFPVGAALARKEFARHLGVASHGTTYGGNPLACAVAQAVLTEITRPELQANVAARAAQLRAGLRALDPAAQVFTEIRGLGLLLGCALHPHFATRAPELVKACAAHGLIALVAGPDTLRLAPPLNLSEADAAEALQRLGAALATFRAPAPVAAVDSPAGSARA